MNASPEPRPLIPGFDRLYAVLVPLSWPVVRLAVGGILAVHGWGKLVNFSGAIPNYVKLGYHQPALIVAILLVIEFFGGVAIALGLFTRFFAAAAAIEMAELTFDIYLSNGFGWRNSGYEYVLMWGLLCFAIALRGGGPYSLDRKIGVEL